MIWARVCRCTVNMIVFICRTLYGTDIHTAFINRIFKKSFEFAFTHFYSHIIMKLFKITKKTLRNEMTKNRKLECTLEKTHRTGFGLRPYQLIINKCNRKINYSNFFFKDYTFTFTFTVFLYFAL